MTVEKLVTAFGYPKKLYDLQFDWRYMTRGLVIDKKRGNMLKIDRHKYVKLASHGFRALSRDERMATYNNTSKSSWCVFYFYWRSVLLFKISFESRGC